MKATITPASGTSQPLFGVFAGLLARAQRPASTERRSLAASTGLSTDRDHLACRRICRRSSPITNSRTGGCRRARPRGHQAGHETRT